MTAGSNHGSEQTEDGDRRPACCPAQRGRPPQSQHLGDPSNDAAGAFFARVGLLAGLVGFGATLAFEAAKAALVPVSPAWQSHGLTVLFNAGLATAVGLWGAHRFLGLRREALREIATRERAQQCLRESDARYKVLTDNVKEVIFQTDAEGRWTYLSAAWSTLTGFSIGESLGQPFLDYVYPDDRATNTERFVHLIESGDDHCRHEIRYRHVDGEPRWVEVFARLVFDGNGNLAGTTGTLDDITSRRAAEEEVRQAREELETRVHERTVDLARANKKLEAEIAERSHGEEEIRNLNSQLEHRFQRIAALRQIDIAIGGSLDLRLTLGIFLDQVINQLGVDAASVLLSNPRTQTLEYAVGRGFRTTLLRHAQLRFGQGHAGRAAFDRKIYHVQDLASATTGATHLSFVKAEGFISYYAVPLLAKGQVKGVLEIFQRAPFEGDVEWVDYLETLAGQAAIAIDNASLFDDLQRTNMELTRAYDATIEGWSRALDLRDKETDGHSQRVTDMTTRLARSVGMSEADLVHVRRGALLHDIGKLGVPDSILLKPGPLTDEEWVVMRRHTVYAYEMLSPIAFLRPALDIPYCHHEKWDGTGYPRALKDEQIPLSARLFAMADVWDALRSDRPYRKGWPEEKVCEHIRSLAGTHFDPALVDLFLKVVPGTAEASGFNAKAA